MPGNSPGEAVKRFLAPIKDAIGVLGDMVLLHSNHPQLGERQGVVMADDRGLRVDSSLYGTLRVAVGLNYEVILCEPGDPRGPYRCSTRSYIHTLYDSQGKLLIAFHWHPEGMSPERGPHMHVGDTRVPQAASLHVPTPRITVEEFIAIAVDSFGAKARVEDEAWRPLLEDNRKVHEQYRDWHHRTDAPTQFG